MFDLIERLCRQNGVSGDEDRVAALIEQEITPYAQRIWRDEIGNLCAFRKGARTMDKKVALFAHMDEVGFMITDIDEKGLLRFHCVGGVDPRILPGKRLYIGPKGIPGVVGMKAVHLQDKEEKSRGITYEDIFLDIGAKDREDAERLVALGDYAAFEARTVRFGENLYGAKALDDRVGCAILIELIKKEPAFDTYYCFSAEEETGTYGARAFAWEEKPDIGLILETTTAADVGGVPAAKRMCQLGKGPVISAADGSTVYDNGLIRLAKDAADSQHIPYQIKQGIAGGNDARSVQRAAGAARVLAVSIACRYLHAPLCVAHTQDIIHGRALTEAILARLEGE